MYANKGENHQTLTNQINKNPQSKNNWPQSSDDDNLNGDHHGPVVIQPAYKRQDKVSDSDSLREYNSTYSAEQTIKVDGAENLKVMALTLAANDKNKDNLTKEGDKKRLVYKSLGGIRLKKPIRLQLWLDINRETFGSRTNPQCVHWSTLRG